MKKVQKRKTLVFTSLFFLLGFLFVILLSTTQISSAEGRGVRAGGERGTRTTVERESRGSNLCERYGSSSRLRVPPECVPPPPVDTCPNVPGNQTSGPCADQQCVTQGGTWNGASCDFPPPPPTDVCPNVPGGQSVGPCADTECEEDGGTWNGTSCDFPPPPPACSDGADNDSDGNIDFPSDAGCTDANDTDEAGGSGGSSGGGGSPGVSTIEVVKISESFVHTPNESNPENSIGEFRITLRVTNVGSSDVYIPLAGGATSTAGASQSGVGGAFGVAYLLTNNAGTASTTNIGTSLTRVSGGIEKTNSLQINGGQSADLLLILSFNPDASFAGASQFRVRIAGVGYATNDTIIASSYVFALPAEDFLTAFYTINNSPLPSDVCPNVSGTQESGPCADESCVNNSGTWNGESCVVPPPVGITATLVHATSTLIEDESGTQFSEAGFFAIFFDVTAVGGTVYIPGFADSMSASIGAEIDENLYLLERQGTAVNTIFDEAILYDTNSGAVLTQNDNIEIEEGETVGIAIGVVRLNENIGDEGIYQFALKAIAWDVVDNVYANGVNQYNAFTTGLESFKTDPLFLTNPN